MLIYLKSKSHPEDEVEMEIVTMQGDIAKILQKPLSGPIGQSAANKLLQDSFSFVTRRDGHYVIPSDVEKRMFELKG